MKIAQPIINEITPESSALLIFRGALKPWIEASWISSAQLEELGELIIKQQEVLIGEGLCLVDARPSNYWLGTNQPRLVDLASIKELSKHSLASFLADFLRHIIHPLLLEQQLGLPVSSYFKAGLANINIRTSGLLMSYQSIAMLKEMGRQSITHRLSTMISSASVDFIRFLRDESGDELHKAKNYDNKLIRKGLSRLRRMDKLLQKACQSQRKAISDWSYYGQVHDVSYLEAKQNAVKEFLAESEPGMRIVDLGANLTHQEHQRVNLLIDQDLTVCRKLWELRGKNAHVLQLDVAAALVSPGSNDFKALNLGGSHHEALVLGLIHHLLIDAGLTADAFYLGLSKLFKRVLLEFPSVDDPMVQLLMRKKDESVDRSWEKQRFNAQRYFTVTFTKKLSETRQVAYLEAIK